MEKKKADRMIVCKRKACETYVDNYLFLTSIGFNLSNNKLSFVLNLPLGVKEEIENINLLARQPIPTQDFLYKIDELSKIVKIVFLDENNFCLVKGITFKWSCLEEEITKILKDSYKDGKIEVHRGLFGDAEEKMVEVVREYSGQRVSELMLEETLSFLKKDFNI
jgi:hypothetical protein